MIVWTATGKYRPGDDEEFDLTIIPNFNLCNYFYEPDFNDAVDNELNVKYCVPHHQEA